jgi:hypothetical protein
MRLRTVKVGEEPAPAPDFYADEEVDQPDDHDESPA